MKCLITTSKLLLLFEFLINLITSHFIYFFHSSNVIPNPNHNDEMSLSFSVLGRDAASRIVNVSDIVSSANGDDIVNGMIKSESDKLSGDIKYDFK